MISLTDSQLQTVMGAGAKLEPERRDIFLRRVGAMLRVRGRSPTLTWPMWRGWRWPALSTPTRLKVGARRFAVADMVRTLK